MSDAHSQTLFKSLVTLWSVNLAVTSCNTEITPHSMLESPAPAVFGSGQCRCEGAVLLCAHPAVTWGN